MCCSSQCFLQSIGTNQWCRTVERILFLYILWNVNPSVLGIKLLLRALLIKDVRQVVCTERLVSLWVQRWQRLIRHICLNVVPLSRDILLLENKLFLSHVYVFIKLLILATKVQIKNEIQKYPPCFLTNLMFFESKIEVIISMQGLFYV